MSHRYQFGRFEVRPSTRQLLAAGQPVALGERAFDVLLCLLRQQGGAVSKDTLMACAWPGLVVEDNNLSVQIAALRKLLGPEALVTLRGRGYQLALEVSELATPALAPTLTNLAPLEKPSIAVLPFSNLSGDAKQAYFADGITKDIITELSRFHTLFVMARQSAFIDKERASDVRSVARELDVRYVLEGSTRRVARRIRVTVQLIDALTGNHIWAEKYDRVLVDMLALQEELTQAIVAAVAPQVESFEMSRVCALPPGQLSAYQLALRGWAAAWAGISQSDRAVRIQAMTHAHAALALDSRCGAALRTLAFAHWQDAYSHSAASVDQAIEEGTRAATRALAIAPDDHIAYLWQGLFALLRGQPQAALADVRRAHEVNPNDALALAYLGMVESLCGNPLKGVEHATVALRLSPRDPLRFAFLNALAWSCFCAGDYAQGTEAAQRCLSAAPGFAAARLGLVINLVGLSDIDQAREQYPAWRLQAPELVALRLGGQWLTWEPDYCRRATTFLRVAASLQEPATASAVR
ncbi:MAG: winged helix-turn-helix domain-containing tetratricopeptide repeat protein [Polaromonas sp.]